MSSPKPEHVNIKNIRGPGVTNTGTFRVAKELFGWRNSDTNEILQLEAKTIEEVEWWRISSKEYMLSFVMKDTHDKKEFAGFKEHDLDILQTYIKKHWNKTITTGSKLGSRGWHWGEWAFRNKRFCLDVDGKRTIEIPLNKLVSVNANKADVVLELKHKENGASSEDVVTEIKFCVPPPKDSDAADTAEYIKASILDASGLGSADTSALVCTFPYKNCLQPPGRFDVQFYPTSIRLHGKSFDYRVLYENIAAAYILADVQSSKLLLSLINPLKKGNTKYPAVIVCLEDKSEETMTLNASPEVLDELRQVISIPDGATEISAMEPVIAGQLLSILGKKRLLGETDFKSSTGHPSFVCSHKIHSGWFYPLAEEFVYLAKPVITVPFGDISSLNLGRTQGQQTRLFEFSISLKSGVEYEFNQVDRQELQPLVDFVQKKGLKMREMLTETREEEEGRDDEEGENEEDESEDEDFDDDDDEEDDEEDEEEDGE